MDKKHKIYHGKHCHAAGNGFVESIIHMILEHYDTEEYHNTLFVMWPGEGWHDEDIFYKKYDNDCMMLDVNRMHEIYDKIIFYDLEHTHEYRLPWIYPDWLQSIDEIWTPWMENLSCYMPIKPENIKFMPLRSCKFLEDRHIPLNDNPLYDAGFFGTWTPYRHEVLIPILMSPLTDTDKKCFYISGVNQYEIPNIIANTKFILDLDQKWCGNLRSQNVVRICEAICMGRKVISDKSIFNYFKGMVVEVDNPFENLTETIQNTTPYDYSAIFKEMTYTNKNYEIYKRKLTDEYRKNILSCLPPIIPNPKFDRHRPI